MDIGQSRRAQETFDPMSELQCRHTSEELIGEVYSIHPLTNISGSIKLVESSGYREVTLEKTSSTWRINSSHCIILVSLTVNILLGKVLGRGGFADVFACRLKSTPGMYAVRYSLFNENFPQNPLLW